MITKAVSWRTCSYFSKVIHFLQTYKHPSHTTYNSPSSQNEMIQSCFDIKTAVIISEIKAAKMYSNIVDEGWDRQTSATIADTTEEQLVKHGLDHLACDAQAYDCASSSLRTVPLQRIAETPCHTLQHPPTARGDHDRKEFHGQERQSHNPSYPKRLFPPGW